MSMHGARWQIVNPDFKAISLTSRQKGGLL
jgi:hypothetical protein